MFKFFFFVLTFTDPNPCHPNPCKNGGMCTRSDSEEKFSCICEEGFKGQQCDCKKSLGKQIVCCTHDLSITLSFRLPPSPPCFLPSFLLSLLRSSGFFFSNLLSDSLINIHGSFTALNKCDPNPCKNGATCQQMSDDKFVCICPPSFKGTLCTGNLC